MASRLLAQLDAEIDAAKDPLQRERLRAERAGVLARHGNIGQARRIVNELRSRPSSNADPELACWLGLAEGMIDHFDAVLPRSRPRFQRAHALAKAAGLDQLQALAAAWLAVVEWNEMNVEPAIERVAEALRLSAEDAHSARARACLVAADAWLYTGAADRAKPWFDRARGHAGSDGDMSMVSVLLYNRAACLVSLVHLDDTFGRSTPEQAAQALLEAESTGHFDAGVGTASLLALVPILRAQALLVQHRYAEALPLYEAHLESGQRQGFTSGQWRLRVDRTLCRHHTGAADGVLAELRQAIAEIGAATPQPDDEAAAYGRAAALFRLLGEEAEASSCQQRAEGALTAFRAWQERVGATLQRTLSGV